MSNLATLYPNRLVFFPRTRRRVAYHYTKKVRREKKKRTRTPIQQTPYNVKLITHYKKYDLHISHQLGALSA
jgi:hypothetical protein